MSCAIQYCHDVIPHCPAEAQTPTNLVSISLWCPTRTTISASLSLNHSLHHSSSTDALHHGLAFKLQWSLANVVCCCGHSDRLSPPPSLPRHVCCHYRSTTCVRTNQTIFLKKIKTSHNMHMLSRSRCVTVLLLRTHPVDTRMVHPNNCTREKQNINVLVL